MSEGKKKKVLFVMVSLYNGGAEKSLVNLLNTLPPERYELDLLLFRREGMFLPQVPAWVHILETPYALECLYKPVLKSGRHILTKLAGNIFARLHETQILRIRGYRWRYYRRVIRKLDGHYDVAVAYFSGDVMYYVNEKTDADRKYVWVHNDYRAEGQPRDYDLAHITAMDGIVSVSEGCVASLAAEFPELEGKLWHIPNITSGRLVRQRAEEFFPPEYVGCENAILSVGRLSDSKGFDMAVSAAAELKRKGYRFRWFVIGDGDRKRSLERQIRAEGVEDCFTLLGTRENPYPYMKNCTVFVQPSRYEGKSVVLDEAKILACPIVATAYTTVRDQIADGEEGLVCEMNAQAIAGAVGSLLADSERRERLSALLSHREYGNENEIEKYLRLIDG